MPDLITEPGYRTRIAEYSKSDWNDTRPIAEELVRYLRFANEIPLLAPVKGNPTFVADFAVRGPRDGFGRSQRDFDLQGRIFRYPCSYLIYSEDFEALPVDVNRYIYGRLYDVLTGHDQSPVFASLTAENRQSILGILAATKPDLPQQWKQSAARQPLGKFNTTAVSVDPPCKRYPDDLTFKTKARVLAGARAAP